MICYNYKVNFKFLSFTSMLYELNVAEDSLIGRRMDQSGETFKVV